MTSSGKEHAPGVLLRWALLYRSVPKVYVPGTQLDISFSLLSAFVLFCVKLMGERILESFGWPEGAVATKEGAASIAAIFHSTNLVPGLWLCLRTQPYIPSAKMSDSPSWWQDAVTALLQFCTGYMIYDGLVNIVLLRYTPGLGVQLTASDWMFLGHHFATSFYMTSARILQAGHISALICMIVGEATNPVHNSFMIAQLAKTLDCCNGPTSQQLQVIIEILFSALYILFRVVIGPVALLHITYDIVFTKRGRQNVPIVLRILWTLMIWAVVFGSIPWIQECIDMLKAHVGGMPTDKEL